jgi:glycosyltransferase involved in cell wall biosynthesis
MKQRRRVGIVIGQLSLGGTERQAAVLAQGLAGSLEYEPRVFCVSEVFNPLGKTLSDAGIACFHPGSRRKSSLARLLWLTRELSAARCDLVYGLLNVGNIYAGAAAALLGIPLVASIRSANSGLPFTIRTLSGYFCRRARWIVANSDSCRDSLKRALGVRHDRVSVVHNGIPIEVPDGTARACFRARIGCREGELVVGTVALLKPEKRPLFFIDVLTSYREVSDRSAHFVWVGDGSELDRARQATSVLSQDERAHLHFLPATTEIADVLAGFDVFALTSAYEGFPNAMLEAMAAGLSCVATDVPGTRDVSRLLNCGNPVLASATDPKAFALELARLVGDPQRMLSLAAAGRAGVIEYCSPEKMVKAHISVFDSVLADANGRACDR